MATAKSSLVVFNASTGQFDWTELGRLGQQLAIKTAHLKFAKDIVSYGFDEEGGESFVVGPRPS